jgi:hypothetical protein
MHPVEGSGFICFSTLVMKVSSMSSFHFQQSAMVELVQKENHTPAK